MENSPLVSIIVITYNSAKFVLETLESAKNQTYQNIELIITDDGSKDDTVDICRKWIDANKERFLRADLLTVKKNTGTSSNCNRGLKASKGKWIKLIAGDDILEENSIKRYLKYVLENPNSKAIFGLSLFFNHIEGKNNVFEIRPAIHHINFFHLDAKSQLKKFTSTGAHHLEAPAFFIEKNLLKSLGGYDENYPLFEDYPLYLTILEKGYKLHLVNKNCVYKRFYEGSVFNKIKKSKTIITPFELDAAKFNLFRKSKYTNVFKQLDFLIVYYLFKAIIYFGNKGWLFEILYKKRWMLSPNSLVNGIKVKFSK